MFSSSRSSSSRPSMILCSMLFLAACDDATTEQRKSMGSQTTANTQVVQETNAAAQKVATAQAEANDKIVAAVAEADQKSRVAQNEVDAKVVAAKEAFLKVREEYRHDLETKLIELNRSVAELELKAGKAVGQTHVEMHARLKKIRAQRDIVAKSCKALETESATTWDETKARVDREWAELKALLDIR